MLPLLPYVGCFLLEYAALKLTAVAIEAICIKISGIIDKAKLRSEMRNNCNNFIIKEINNCTNRVKLEDMCSNQEYICHGDGISNELYEGQIIYV